MKIEIKDICKQYNNTIALDNVTTTFKSGRITGLVGRNGAGKTTLIGLLTNKRIPTSGEILIDNVSSQENREVLQNISVVAQDFESQLATFGVKSLVENYKYYYQDFDLEYFEELCKKFKLEYKKKILYQNLSTGYQNILKSLLVLATNSKIMIFDEPTLGLDAIHRDLYYKVLIEKYSELNNTIIISTHLIEEISSVVEDLCVVHRSKILYSGSAEDFVKPFAPAGLQEAFIEFTKGADNNE